MLEGLAFIHQSMIIDIDPHTTCMIFNLNDENTTGQGWCSVGYQFPERKVPFPGAIRAREWEHPKAKKISQNYGYVLTFSQVFVTEVLVVVSWGVNNQQKTSRQILAKCQP